MRIDDVPRHLIVSLPLRPTGVDPKPQVTPGMIAHAVFVKYHLAGMRNGRSAYDGDSGYAYAEGTYRGVFTDTNGTRHRLTVNVLPAASGRAA